ncbi:MAG: excinuclease ABC subunit UvrA [bacterium]|nr:excinuclease ABC subunit UvrA [bacterium]
MNTIEIKGAKTHNLKNINISIPRDKFVVITGLSGSGKSSLAFDTIYVEGHRRYVESLSSYARQFLGQMQKPPLESISGLSPAIAIQQKGKGYNPRSTVGTMTEIYDYMRVLFARVGTPHCPKCKNEVKPQTIQEIVETVMSWSKATKISILAPLVKNRKGEYRELFDRLKKEGFLRIRIDSQTFHLEEDIRLSKNKKHNISVIIDRVKIIEENQSRISDSIETALKEGNGEIIIIKDEKNIFFSESFSCQKCNLSFKEITPQIFSFNNPHGACSQCAGLGIKMNFDEDLIISDKNKPLKQTIKVPGFSEGSYSLEKIEHLINLELSFNQLTKKKQEMLIHGSDYFEGFIPLLWRRYKQTPSEETKRWYEKLMHTYTCPTCQGNRLSSESLAVKIANKNIIEISQLAIKESRLFFNKIEFHLTKQKLIAEPVIKEIQARLNFLFEVGLGYLNLMRKSATLSGGEAQRINLATQIGAGLMGVLYVLDEPSIGLHQKDNRKLLNTMKRLRDLGNTVLVVEHDEETIKEADHIIDLGVGAGKYGGEVVAEGSFDQILTSKKSLTAQYLNGKIKIKTPENRRKPKNFIKIINATANNLKNINAKIPLGVLSAVTGVSGSGKSTLVEEILYKAIRQKKSNTFKEIKNLNLIDKVINIDQSPIGRTPRSNSATYTGIFTAIRELFAGIPEAKARGYKVGRFSFNVKGGRCEACQGDGVQKIEMHFLPDVYVTCDVCKRTRYERETLEILYKGKNISDILNMSVDESYLFFQKIPRIERGLKLLQDVGLGYLHLGQSATTLSGGEAQRIKLASELSKRATGKTLYILDEPTTGLHFADVHKLLEVLNRLVNKGNSVLVIEHNLDVIKTCDYLTDLGPDGGDEGGEIIIEGTPEDVAQCRKSYTGKYLKEVL